MAQSDERDPDPHDCGQVDGARLRLLSYNIQVGISSSRYRHYLTRGWKHVLPFRGRVRTLDAIAEQIRRYDLVGLQEVDSGSLRTGRVNQTEYLAQAAHFPWWQERTNRRIGQVARHSIGVLSRLRPLSVGKLSLPGPMPGRGALILEFGAERPVLSVLIVHLSLGRRARASQLAYIGELVQDRERVIVMGDFNSCHDSPEMSRLFAATRLLEPTVVLNTWPSWRPVRNLDHILITPSVQVERFDALSISHSDHLPLAMEVSLPPELDRAAA